MLIKFLIIFLGFLALASGACLLRKTSEMADDEVMVICWMIEDLKSEMMKIPVDKTIVNMKIVESKIPKIESGTFERIGTKLKKLEILHSGVEEIEDHAFKGLTELMSLTLMKNKLEAVKVAWIEDMPSLTEIDLNGNMIVDVETEVVNKVPKLTSINIMNNKITCIDLDKLDILKDLKMLKTGMNPLTWKCMVELVDWRKNHPNISGELIPMENGMDKLVEAVKECLKTLPNATEEIIDTCVEKKMSEMGTK